MNPFIFTSVLDNYLPEPQSSLLNGMIFGIDLKTSRSFYDQIKTVGLLHLVVLSGTNITLLGAIIGSLTSYFSKQMSALIAVLTIFLFVVFVGPKAPIVRAGVMGILTYVAILKGRKNFVLYSLFVSLVFIAVFFPEWLTGVSLQLSYAATIGIVFFGKTSSTNQLWKELKISLAAQLLTTPIIFLYFRQVSFISPLANLLVAPVVAPLMVFGLVAAVFGKIHFVLGWIPSFVCYGLLTYMVWVIKILSRIPFAFHQF